MAPFAHIGYVFLTIARTRYVVWALGVIQLVVLALVIVSVVIFSRRLRDVTLAVEETREAQNLTQTTLEDTQTTLEDAVEARQERWAKVDGECDENDRLRGHGG